MNEKDSRNYEFSEGLSVIKSVVDDIHDLMQIFSYNSDRLNLFKNTIIDVTELIKEKYSKDVTKFKILTSRVGFIINSVEELHDDCYLNGKSYNYHLIIFADNKIDKLEPISLADLLGLFDLDMTDYAYLTNCTFHFNRSYNVDQFNMIPAVQFVYEMNLY